MAQDVAYDITITHEGVERGYMLHRPGQNSRGPRRWSAQFIGAGVTARTQTEERYGQTDAQIEAPMVWRTWHRGYGEERTRTEGRYHYSYGVDARFPDMLIPAPYVHLFSHGELGNITAFFEMDGYLFYAVGHVVYAMSADGTRQQVASLPATVTDALVFKDVENGQMALLGQGYDDSFVFRLSNADPTAGWTTATGLHIGYLAAHKDRFYASVSEYEVASCATAPWIPQNWSAFYTVGNPNYAITSLSTLGDILYVGKADGLHALDEEGDGGKMLTPELASAADADNCKNTLIWHAQLWVPHSRGLLMYRDMGTQGFVVVPAAPSAWSSTENVVRGRVTAMAGDHRWLYAALRADDGTSYLLAGREAWEGESGPLVWHPLLHLEGDVSRLHLSGMWSNPRLLFGVDNSLGYIILPRDGENPRMDSNCRYSLSGSMYLSSHSWFAPATTKIWKNLSITGKNLTTNRYVEVYYRIDGQGWTYLGTANRTPRTVLRFPETGVSGTRIELRLDFHLPDNSSPCEINEIVMRGVEKPPTIKVVTAAIRCVDNQRLKNGRRERRSGADIMQELEGYAQATQAVLLKDTLGLERRVLVLSPIGEEEIEMEGSDPERVAIVRFATFETEIPTPISAGTAQYGTSRYGGGDVYG